MLLIVTLLSARLSYSDTTLESFEVAFGRLNDDFDSLERLSLSALAIAVLGEENASDLFEGLQDCSQEEGSPEVFVSARSNLDYYLTQCSKELRAQRTAVDMLEFLNTQAKQCDYVAQYAADALLAASLTLIVQPQDSFLTFLQEDLTLFKNWDFMTARAMHQQEWEVSLSSAVETLAAKLDSTCELLLTLQSFFT